MNVNFIFLRHVATLVGLELEVLLILGSEAGLTGLHPAKFSELLNTFALKHQNVTVSSCACFLLFQPWDGLLQGALIPKTVVRRSQQLHTCVCGHQAVSAWPRQQAELCVCVH